MFSVVIVNTIAVMCIVVVLYIMLVVPHNI